MELKNKLEAIAEDYGWKFVYARRDYHNLFDVSQFISDEMEDAGNGETVLFLDPIVRSPESIGMRYSGNFMVLTSNDFDGEYEKDKWETIISPLLQKLRSEVYKDIICDFDINDWTLIEVINMFDFNADGVSVRYNLRGYE